MGDWSKALAVEVNIWRKGKNYIYTKLETCENRDKNKVKIKR